IFLSSILVSRRRAHCLDASPHLGRRIIIPAQLMKRQPVTITPFRIRGSLLEEALECHASVFVLGGLKVSMTDLAPHLAQAVLRVAADHGVEMIDCFGKPALFARNAAELIVRVSFFGIYLDRACEARLRFFALASLLVDQSEIVVCRGISGIQDRGFEVAFEVFARALRADDISEKVPQQDDYQDQQERRGEYEEQPW